MFDFFKKKPASDTAPPAPAENAQPQRPAPEAPQAPAAVAPTQPAAANPSAPAEPEKSWASRLREGLSKTRAKLNAAVGPTLGADVGDVMSDLFSRRKIDDELLDEIETTLLTADCGVQATQYLIDEMRKRWKRDKLETGDQLKGVLMELLEGLLKPLEQRLDIDTHKPTIIMLAGVNGSGKTTSIGKLAKRFQREGKSVILAAGDTFRAAAREQLQEWGRRNDVTVIAQDGGDPAAVIFDAINAARARGIDIVLADTAGRLPTQLHLMEEIAKVRRVIQNALAQLAAFDKAVGVTGLVVTKLDGTAKGGVLAAIARTNPKPIRYIGVGEGIDDLQPFVAREFVEALFDAPASN